MVVSARMLPVVGMSFCRQIVARFQQICSYVVVALCVLVAPLECTVSIVWQSDGVCFVLLKVFT